MFHVPYDGMYGDSNYVESQRHPLSQKAKELVLTNTKHYVDYGYAGTSFNCPRFQQMLNDIETEKAIHENGKTNLTSDT